MKTPITQGVHHVGLTVSNLDASAHFFTSLLGWAEVRRDDNYPAIFVTDGNIMITLWSVKDQSPAKFDRKKNTGLHHIAFHVENEDDLDSIHEKIQKAGLTIEFSPELLREGPAKHMMCYEPSGIRVEFIWPGHEA